MLTLLRSPAIVIMNDKGKQKASSKPTTALAKETACCRALHSLRHEGTSHKESLRQVRDDTTRIHEEKNRCASSLQNCSILSEVSLTPASSRPRKGSLWLASTIARLCRIQVSQRELSNWVRAAHAILNSNETHAEHGGGHQPVPQTKARSSRRRPEEARINLRPAGNGRDVASTSVQAVHSPWCSCGPVAREIQETKSK